MPQVNIVQTPGTDKSVWQSLKQEAAAFAVKERHLASLIHATILDRESLGCAMSRYMAEKLATAEFPAVHMKDILEDAFKSDPMIVDGAASDLIAVRLRDPACLSYLQAFLYFKGFMALQTHRVAHHLWNEGRDLLAYHLQSRSSMLFGVDIHPAAKLGRGIMFDHATGIVIGETAIIDDGCSILHGVTLGGTGKEHEDRHPKLGKGVLVGAGAKILGNIKIGDEARVASGSVVLEDVSSKCTVAGIPAKPISGPCVEHPADCMNQILPIEDEKD